MGGLRFRAGTAAAVFLVGLAGCDTSGPTTYAIRGRVEADGGAGVLVGHTVEAALTRDPTVRASGAIGPDGRFVLQTLHAGRLLTGAREGEYRVRVVLSDDDPARRQQAARAVHRKYLQFETSGLIFAAPVAGEVRLHLSQR
jgi:hypothetical protein